MTKVLTSSQCQKHKCATKDQYELMRCANLIRYEFKFFQCKKKFWKSTSILAVSPREERKSLCATFGIVSGIQDRHSERHQPLVLPNAPILEELLVEHPRGPLFPGYRLDSLGKIEHHPPFEETRPGTFPWAFPRRMTHTKAVDSPARLLGLCDITGPVARVHWRDHEGAGNRVQAELRNAAL